MTMKMVHCCRVDYQPSAYRCVFDQFLSGENIKCNEVAGELGPFGPHVVQFLEDLGNKISNINVERRSKSFLFQSIGIAIQRGNASCVMGTTGSMEKLEELNYL